MAKRPKPQSQRAARRAALPPEERQRHALEEMSDSLAVMQSHVADIALWVAHIGRTLDAERRG